MARIRKSTKGFTIIELSFDERQTIGWESNCEKCEKQEKPSHYHERREMFYVATVDDLMCQECYEEWYANNNYTPNQKEHEELEINRLLTLLKEKEINWTVSVVD